MRSAWFLDKVKCVLDHLIYTFLVIHSEKSSHCSFTHSSTHSFLLTLSVTYNSISLFYATLFYPLPPSLTHVRTHALKNSKTLLLTYIVLTHTLTQLRLYLILLYYTLLYSTGSLARARMHSLALTQSLARSLTH